MNNACRICGKKLKGYDEHKRGICNKCIVFIGFYSIPLFEVENERN